MKIVNHIIYIIVFTFFFSSQVFASATEIGRVFKYQNCKGSGYDYGDPLGSLSSTYGPVVNLVYNGLGERSGNMNCYEVEASLCPTSHPQAIDFDEYMQPTCGQIEQCDDQLSYSPHPFKQPPTPGTQCGQCATGWSSDNIASEYDCVANVEEVCYSDLESESEKCQTLEPPPLDNTCVVDEQSGKEFCLNEDPGCYTVDGETFCPEPEEVCGIKNGTYKCVSPQQEGCGYFNGEKVCFDPDGNKVPPDSPDFPDNGGNLDGDETNDVTDPRTPDEGGDPDNQPGVLTPTTDDNRASEKTARDQLNELRKINKKLKELPKKMGDKDLLPSESDVKSDLEEAGSAAFSSDGGMGELKDSINDNPLAGSSAGNHADAMGDTLGNLLPDGTCTSLSFGKGALSFTITCEQTSTIRHLLGWILYALTAIYLFNTVVQSSGSKN